MHGLSISAAQVMFRIFASERFVITGSLKVERSFKFCIQAL